MGLSLSTRRRRPSHWSDLLPELGGLILRRLPSYDDRLSFIAVCHQWRLAAQQERSSLPPALPWIRRLKDPLDVQPPTTSTAIRLGSTDGWLKYYNNNITDTCFFLINPFTGATVPLPPVRPLYKPFLKIVVCSPDLFAATLNGRTAIGFCRLGATSWSVFPRDVHGCWRWHEDIAFHRGKLHYCLPDTDDLFCHDLVHGDKAVEHVIKEQPPSANISWSPTRYLVDSCCKLLMVKWIDPCTLLRLMDKRSAREYWWDEIRLKVFQADLDMGRWLELKDSGLDGHALFVSANSSKAIPLSSSSKNQKFQWDHVYFPGAELQWMDKSNCTGRKEERQNQSNCPGRKESRYQRGAHFFRMVLSIHMSDI